MGRQQPTGAGVAARSQDMHQILAGLGNECASRLISEHKPAVPTGARAMATRWSPDMCSG